MIPIGRTLPVFDILVSLIRSREWEFEQLMASEAIVHVPSLRFSHTYKFAARRDADQDSLYFDLSRVAVVPWKMHRALQVTARSLNLHAGPTIFSFAINAVLKLRCCSKHGRAKPQQKPYAVEKKLDDALVRMDYGWDAIQIVSHTGMTPIDAVRQAKRRADENN